MCDMYNGNANGELEKINAFLNMSFPFSYQDGLPNRGE